MTSIWAHRGAAADAPGNTIPAFELAIEQGADGIELDVHLSRDGVLVVHHDETVTLPSGETARIVDLSLEEVRSVDVGSAEFGPAEIPTLREVYDLIAPTNLRLNVELKNGLVTYPGIEEAVIAMHGQSGMNDRIVYSSFNHFSLVALLALAPEIEAAALYSAGLVDPWLYVERLGIPGVHPFYKNLTAPGVLDGYRETDIAVRPWTVDDPDDWHWLIGERVDAIITNRPGAAIAVRDAIGAA